MSLGIEPARSTDVSVMLALLAQHRLPAAGLEGHIETALVAREEGRVVGCAAVEVYGTAGLLRSVAVEASRRGGGIGTALVRAALELARARGIAELYLLTETARDYFARFGFRVAARAEVAEAVRRSAEFAEACAESAIVMVREP